MTPNYVYINGDFVLKEDAKILITDLSVQRGYGIFDYFKTINNQPVFLDDHLDRFYFSAREMFLPVDMERDALKDILQQLIKKNNLPDSGIRITLTGGYSADGYLPAKPNMFITQLPFSYSKDNFEKGTRLVTYEHQRQLAQVKTIDYLQAIRLQTFIKKNNADDVLYYAASGISECPRANFFMINDKDEIITPDKNILAGITRKKILSFDELAVKERTILPDDIATAREAFVTSTSKLILPVLEINGTKIGHGKPGEITKELFKQMLTIQGM